MIDAYQANEIQARMTIHDAWVDSIRNKNGWASYMPEDKPAHILDVSNAERSALEVFRFYTDIPIKYFLYIDERQHAAITWTGEKLGDVGFGREWRDNFGGKRVSINVQAINGLLYHGTYYKSSGNYARIKLAKKSTGGGA
jgi:hypothetical protein